MRQITNELEFNISSFTPFAKSNGRLFSKTKIYMMPSSNLQTFLYIYEIKLEVIS